MEKAKVFEGHIDTMPSDVAEQVGLTLGWLVYKFGPFTIPLMQEMWDELVGADVALSKVTNHNDSGEPINATLSMVPHHYD
jgi:hypothetical protein